MAFLGSGISVRSGVHPLVPCVLGFCCAQFLVPWYGCLFSRTRKPSICKRSLLLPSLDPSRCSVSISRRRPLLFFRWSKKRPGNDPWRFSLLQELTSDNTRSPIPLGRSLVPSQHLHRPRYNQGRPSQGRGWSCWKEHRIYRYEVVRNISRESAVVLNTHFYTKATPLSIIFVRVSFRSSNVTP